MDVTATEIALVALVLFFVLLLMLGVPKMIFGALDQQAREISAELDEAKRLREEAEMLKAKYEAQLAAAQGEAAALVASAKEQAKLLAEEARANLAETLARRERQAEERIAQAEMQAIAQVRGAVVDAAVAAAEKALRERMDAQAHSALVAEGSAELAKKFG